MGRRKKKQHDAGIRYDIPPEEFVEVWTKAPNVDAVVAATGMPRNAAYSRAAAYRRKGIELKMMTTGRPTRRMDVAALNAIIASYKPKK